jgi:hypothetical protein
MAPTLIQIPTLNDAPRDFCVLNKRAEENERLTICKQLKWFWFYPQIAQIFYRRMGGTSVCSSAGKQTLAPPGASQDG